MKFNMKIGKTLFPSVLKKLICLFIPGIFFVIVVAEFILELSDEELTYIEIEEKSDHQSSLDYKCYLFIL